VSPELHALAGAYVLDALDNGERDAFEQHLNICHDCEDEVRTLRQAAAELSHLSASTPPPGLRGDVLAAIEQVRPLAPLADNVVALHRGRVHRSLWQLMAVACAIIALVTGNWGYQQHRDANRKATAGTSILDSVLNASDVEATSAPACKGRATMVYSRSQHSLMLIGHGMPSPGPAKTFQLWMISPDGTATSGGIFTPDSAGDVRHGASGDIAGSTRMGISIEPAHGSPQPTPGNICATTNLR
jgi:anti-sigma-K factor RskA